MIELMLYIAGMCALLCIAEPLVLLHDRRMAVVRRATRPVAVTPDEPYRLADAA